MSQEQISPDVELAAAVSDMHVTRFRNKAAGLRSHEKIYILMALAASREALNVQIHPSENTGYIPKNVYTKFKEILTKPNFVGQVPWIPSHNALRAIWRQFREKQTVEANRKGNVGRKKKACREEVEFLVKHTNMSSGQICKSLNQNGQTVSRSTVSRIARLEV